MVRSQKVSRASVNTTEARAWLAEVPSAALVQSVNDSRRAWRNFFDSVTGKRAGRKVGRPRFKSRKDQRQSALNAIASVVAARPGIITNADLPPRGFAGRFKLQPVIRKRG